MNERRIPEALLACYVAMVLGPALYLWGRSTGRLPVAGAVALAFAAGLASGLAVRTVDDLPAAVESWRVVALTVLPPLAYFPYMILGSAPGSTDALAAVVGLLAVAPGIAVPTSGAAVRNRRLRATATEIAVVTVGGDRDERGGRNWPVIAGVTVAGLGVIVAGAVVVLTGGGDFGSVTTGLGGLSTVLLLFASDDDETELAVTDNGLRIDRSMTRWDALDGYRVTAEEIQFVRRQWYAPARSFEREKVSDEDALLAGLGEFLPRLDERGRVEMAARRGDIAG